MQLTVVGCWSPYPAPGSACSAYLVQTGEEILLIDCGHGAMAQLANYIEPQRLTGVIITHSHPDHYNDLSALNLYWRLKGFLGHELGRLPVWFPPGDKASGHWQAVPEFEVKVASGSTKLGSFELEFTEGSHALPISMVKVTQGNQSLFYTGDTAFTEQGVEASRNCNLLVAECTLPPSEADLARQLGHLTWEQCGRWATLADCPNLLATHFWPDYDRQEIAKVVKQNYVGNLLMAYPGLIVEV